MKLPVWVATSTVGAKIAPPRTRQLNTTSRPSGRYQEQSATVRKNCWNELEPSRRELQVSSSEDTEPRDGSNGLLTCGTVPVAVSVASTAFWRRRATSSGVQALEDSQKLSEVAWVLPYERVYASDSAIRFLFFNGPATTE